jgi:hypothetical protein
MTPHDSPDSRTGPSLRELLAGKDEDLRALVELVARFTDDEQFEWLYAEVRFGPLDPATFVPATFAVVTRADPKAALAWLQTAEPPYARLVPASARDWAWRLWLIEALEDGSADALAWAGVSAGADGRIAGLPSSIGVLPPRRALQPRNVPEQFRRAIAEHILERSPVGLQLLGALPPALLRWLSAEWSQELWRKLIERGQAAEALTLLDRAPAHLRPTPTQEDAARLLQSGEGEVRLAALRLLPHLERAGSTAARAPAAPEPPTDPPAARPRR